jgi:hypothetical protein
MKKVVFIALSMMLMTGMALQAQKITLKSGGFEALKGQKTFLVTYDYSGMAVGKFDKEDDYVADKTADYNKDEAGKGDKWKTAWYEDRGQRYQPKFEELFNKVMADEGMKCDQNAKDAKYQIVVHTTFIEPGFNVGVMRKDASLNAEIKIVETATGKEVAFVTVTGCPGRGGMGYDFDTGFRIEEGYAKLGKSIAGFMLKKM